ncbi:hypothetical protein [Streptomyces thermolilacinus]|uniref:hypothetical protein n=1 Tax=Streptomyces thermolilacinus TaxID=285540 RepID=UPI003F4CB10C
MPLPTPSRRGGPLPPAPPAHPGPAPSAPSATDHAALREADAPLPGAAELTAAGAAVQPVPGCGHNTMLGNPEAFARAVAGALAG